MAAAVIATEGLTKRYGDVVAVDSLSLAVPTGGVFGLLGPNGAGKTTIIGMLLGLTRPDAGRIELFGTDTATGHDSLVQRIGAIMETPAAYPYLSGRDNLRYFQGIGGTEDPAEIERVLEVVGLTERAGSPFAGYSLGMKYRLGIAFSLLGDPNLLLLDEPTNGLDPGGVAEVRALIRSLGSAGKTILLASHLLAEVQQVCTRVAILSHGRVVAERDVAELLGSHNRIRLRTTDDVAATRLLATLEFVESVLADDGLTLVADPTRAADISAALAAQGIYLSHLSVVASSLEEYFLSVTEEAGS